MENRLFLKFMHGIEDVHAKNGKFVTNQFSNEGINVEFSGEDDKETNVGACSDLGPYQIIPRYLFRFRRGKHLLRERR